jgi:integrase
MPPQTRGTIYRTRTAGFAIRWPEGGERPTRSGFRTRTEAREWFDRHVAPRLRRDGPSAEVTFATFCDEYLDRWGADVAPRTRTTVQQWLAPARAKFGGWTLAELEGAADDIARWRARIATDDQRHKQTRALRQVLAAAVRWRYIHSNPAADIGPNRQPRREELEPFTPDELAAIIAELADSPRDAGIVTFAAQTGLRTSEWPALERRDIDWRNPAVTVQRRYARGTLTPYPKTEGSRRRVPLTPEALAALGPARIDTPYLFANRFGERLNYDNWRGRIWAPALDAAGVRQRGPYTLRHCFATRALAVGISIFELSRLMGASVTTIDRHYGHLAHGSEDRIRDLLDGDVIKRGAAR